MAAVGLLSVSMPQAWALSLGRVTVLSALGEPLRAEIDIPSITPDEAATLKTTVASPEAFVAAGLDYNPAMANLRASLQQRSDGRSFIRLSSDRPINDPFVDMILEATWASGKIVRDYTMLFDPPAFRKPSSAQSPTLAQVSPPVSPPVAAPVSPGTVRSTSPTTPTTPAATASPEPTRPAPISRPVPAVPPASVAPASPSGNGVLVKPGDTAGKIAAQFKPQGVSLDQMLVAMLRSNPEVFVNDNINRIRSGKVMNLPSAEDAQATTPEEASQIILAQSKDFNAFRRNLASNVGAAPVSAADRRASGSVEARVDDKKTPSETPDKLTLSKGSIQSNSKETQIAKQLAEREAQARASDIEKNIADLNQIAKSAAAAANTAPAATVPSPAAPSPDIGVPVATPPAPVEPAPAPEAAPVTPPATAPAETPAAPELPVATLPEPEPSVSLLDTLQENPALPAAAGALLLLLGGLAAYKIRQRRKKKDPEEEALESRLQPDSFFGASGGQRVDTSEGDGFKPSSILFSASQLESGDDVDPVAEADVYLAYGRDAQAEEILKEALRTNPGRLAIRTKLLEILAKRRDIKGFESTASQSLVLTTKSSPEWQRICEMGQSIDPSNPLYQPESGSASAAATPSVAASSAAAVALAEMESLSPTDDVAPMEAPVALSVPPDNPSEPVDLDLDFAFDEDAKQLASIPPESPQSVDPVISEPASDQPDIALDLPDKEQDFGLDFESSEATPLAPISESAPLSLTDANALDFDLGGLSLDLDDNKAAAPQANNQAGGDDPFETKLALAEEFHSIGDEEGARGMIEEVIAESSGEMRAKAQQMLSKLGLA
jgi:pilus assembly protein FimV